MRLSDPVVNAEERLNRTLRRSLFKGLDYSERYTTRNPGRFDNLVGLTAFNALNPAEPGRG